MTDSSPLGVTNIHILQNLACTLKGLDFAGGYVSLHYKLQDYQHDFAG